MATSNPEPATDNPEDYPRRVFLESYTYLGIDADGYHHHADQKHAQIIVCDDEGERVGERGWYVELNPSEVDHVHQDDCFKFAYGLEAWADHVATARGWESRDLETFPGLTQSLNAVHGGQR